MKKLHLILICTVITFIVGVFFACQKEDMREVTVLRDCSGTYIRWKSKDYKVCGNELDNYANNAILTVDFHSIGSCNDTTATICELYHPNEGPVWIKKIE